MPTEPNKAIRDILAFYVEAGVDTAIGEMANDYLAPVAVVSVASPSLASDMPAAPSGRAAVPAEARPGIAAPPPADTAVMAAREAARGASSLDELRTILAGFDGCALKGTATQLVFADGNPKARLMFIGEAPGREEDLEGLAFIGRSGKLLDRMLAAIGLDRTQAYIANIVPWRPPGNRTPTPVETQICLPFIQRQIELVDPEILVTIGQPSTAALLNQQGIMKMRGRWFPYHTGRREIRAMPMLHPAYLLRTPIAKRLAWRDFLTLKKALAALTSVTS